MPNSLGDWLRGVLSRKGFRPAAVARRAALSNAYMTHLLRGSTRPKSDTIERISSAAGLSDDERSEFHRLAAAERAGGASGAFNSIPIPGVAVWRYLPVALFKVEHSIADIYVTDAVLPDAVAAFSSLFGTVALFKGMLTAERLEAVTAQTRRLHPFQRESDQNLRANLAIAWRQTILGDRDAVANLCGLLRAWRYQRISDRPAQFVARFNDTGLDKRFSLFFVALPIIVRVCDFFTAEWLLHKLGWPRGNADRVPRTDDAQFVDDAFREIRSIAKRGLTKWLANRSAPFDPETPDKLQALRILYSLPPALLRSLSLVPSRKVFDALRAKLRRIEEEHAAHSERFVAHLERLDATDRQDATAAAEPSAPKPS